jgi:metal-responsive CopG/Arc/MetJ family transcriptional regulator
MSKKDSSRLVQFKMTEKLYKTMAVAAEEDGELNVSDFIRRAIQEKLKRRELEKAGKIQYIIHQNTGGGSQ